MAGRHVREDDAKEEANAIDLGTRGSILVLTESSKKKVPMLMAVMVIMKVAWLK